MADLYYATGQGKIFLADRNTSGLTSGWSWVGDADQFAVQGAQERLTFRESYSGSRAKVIDAVTSTDLSCSMTLRNIDKTNLTRAFLGTATTGTGSTVTAEALSVYANSVAFLRHPGVSSVVVRKGSTVLVAGTDYTLDATFGQLTFLPGSTEVSGSSPVALTVDYTFASYGAKIQGLTTPTKNYAVKFVGQDNFGEKMMVTLWNVSLSVPSELQLIGTEVGALALSGGLQLAPEITGAGLSKFLEIIRD